MFQFVAAWKYVDITCYGTMVKLNQQNLLTVIYQNFLWVCYWFTTVQLHIMLIWWMFVVNSFLQQFSPFELWEFIKFFLNYWEFIIFFFEFSYVLNVNGSMTTPHWGSDNPPPDKNSAQLLPTRTTIPRPTPHQDLPTRTTIPRPTPHKDHYQPVKALIRTKEYFLVRTNTCMVGSCPDTNSCKLNTIYNTSYTPTQSHIYYTSKSNLFWNSAMK